MPELPTAKDGSAMKMRAESIDEMIARIKAIDATDMDKWVVCLTSDTVTIIGAEEDMKDIGHTALKLIECFPAQMYNPYDLLGLFQTVNESGIELNKLIKARIAAILTGVGPEEDEPTKENEDGNSNSTISH
jgi:hypothetical protein